MAGCFEGATPAALRSSSALPFMAAAARCAAAASGAIATCAHRKGRWADLCMPLWLQAGGLVARLPGYLPSSNSSFQPTAGVCSSRQCCWKDVRIRVLLCMVAAAWTHAAHRARICATPPAGTRPCRRPRTLPSGGASWPVRGKDVQVRGLHDTKNMKLSRCGGADKRDADDQGAQTWGYTRLVVTRDPIMAVGHGNAESRYPMLLVMRSFCGESDHTT
jgi:hypothetical protein